MMKRQSRPLLLAVLLIIVLTASGCVGTRLGVSWPGLKLIGDRQQILVSFEDFMVLVDPISGQNTQLIGLEGQPRVDAQGNPRVWDLRPGDQGVGGAQFFGQPLLLDEDTLLAADHANNRLIEIDLPAARIDNPTGISVSGKVVAGLVSDGERVFLPYDVRDLQALELDTRAVAWTFQTANGIWETPLLHDGVLYFTSIDNHLYAVDAETGAERWRVDLGGAAANTPTLHNDRLYVGSFAGKVFSVSLDGQVLAEYETENWVWGAPVVYDDIVYAADLAGFVYALRADDLSEIWKVRINSGRQGIRPSPLVTENFVIVASREGRVKWLNRADGQLVIEREVQAEILSDILLITPNETLDIPEPLVIVSSVARDKLLVAFSLNQGLQQWTYGR